MSIEPNQVTAVILAGGGGRRMAGEDKGWIEFQGRPLVEHVITRLRGQVDHILISANRNLSRYEQLAPVICDEEYPHQGPLSGLYNALTWIETDYVLCVPVDTPFLPENLVATLAGGMGPDCEICVPDDGRQQVLIQYFRRELRQSLGDFLADGQRRVTDWVLSRKLCTVDFSSQTQAFANINDRETLRQLEHERG